MWPWLALNSKSLCLNFLSTGIKGIKDHIQLDEYFESSGSKLGCRLFSHCCFFFLLQILRCSSCTKKVAVRELLTQASLDKFLQCITPNCLNLLTVCRKCSTASAYFFAGSSDPPATLFSSHLHSAATTLTNVFSPI